MGATMAFETKAKIATFGGSLLKLSHSSTTTSTPMALNVFLPPGASASKPAPLLIYLSGLTCTPDNVTEKGFLHAHASKLGLALCFPDTSPRRELLHRRHQGAVGQELQDGELHHQGAPGDPLQGVQGAGQGQGLDFGTLNGRPRCADSVFEEPGAVQERECLGAHCESHEVPMG